MKRTPNPTRMVPVFSARLLFTNIMQMIPAISDIGARLSALKKYKKLVVPADTSMSRMIWAVMAVPTFAPSTIPTDCLKDNSPAPTRPTVRTMVAVEL